MSGKHHAWLVVQMVQYPRGSVENTANPMPCESLRYTVVAGPADVAMNDLSYAFKWFPRATVLNCKVERVIRDVNQTSPRLVLFQKSSQAGAEVG